MVDKLGIIRKLRMRECLEVLGNLRSGRGKWIGGFDFGLNLEWVWVLFFCLEEGEGGLWGFEKRRWILE